jgi:AmmeMemoRadiSam system protein B
MGRRGIREAAVAGSFYPGEKRALNGIVESLVASVRPAPLGSYPAILLVPHAGYPYSGQTAAYAYKTIKGAKYESVVLIGPSHHMHFRGAAVYDGDSWRTPLGDVTVDTELVSKIVESCPVVKPDSAPHEQEHCLEVQMPFLQKVLDQFKVVPLVTLSRSAEETRILAQGLVDACAGRSWLLVASSDLHHGMSYEECVTRSDTTVKQIMEGDPQELEESFAEGWASACGEGAILTALNTASLLGLSPVLLHKTNSGDVMGTRSGYVVGYCSFAFV